MKKIFLTHHIFEVEKHANGFLWFTLHSFILFLKRGRNKIQADEQTWGCEITDKEVEIQDSLFLFLKKLFL